VGEASEATAAEAKGPRAKHPPQTQQKPRPVGEAATQTKQTAAEAEGPWAEPTNEIAKMKQGWVV